MEGFIRINDVLINTRRLIAVERNPERRDGDFSQKEYYLAVFDTGQKLALTPENGAALAECCQSLLTKPSDGMIATTSDGKI